MRPYARQSARSVPGPHCCRVRCCSLAGVFDLCQVALAATIARRACRHRMDSRSPARWSLAQASAAAMRPRRCRAGRHGPGRPCFEPDLLVIPVGSTVEFPNSDSVSHQIYSFSAAKKFPAAAVSGQALSAAALRSGRARDARLQHSRFDARLRVGDRRAVLRPHRSAGSWSAEVPRGTYRVTVWHPRMQENGESWSAQIDDRRGRSRGSDSAARQDSATRAPREYAPLLGRVLTGCALLHARHLVLIQSSLLCRPRANATDWELDLDARLVSSDGRRIVHGRWARNATLRQWPVGPAAGSRTLCALAAARRGLVTAARCLGLG